MGTRNLTAVFQDGEYKVAQYGQWDGYPSGQGLTILNFLTSQGNIDRLKDGLKKVRFLDDEKDAEFIKAYNDAAPEWSSDPDNRTPDQIHWCKTFASRDIGGGILESIASATEDEILLQNNIDFAGDSLLCEWSYVVDLDKGTLEVFEGFNNTELDPSERFASFKCEHNEYKQVKHKWTFKLDMLPLEDDFVSVLEPKDDAE
ncbi:hypothetical protein Dalk_4605 [Desulfatibacillum aliphaticivorans]|uniref:Uncharacterized protein n=1 Tax=Desulfatibacillum aliphaticivorans TaxID=218208 RepID=B8FNK2_DESAL|nr:hypothetical protein [Desulfatibacillum aliphaticivorans]ACL06283.1 hypothetical protein Dalk_4605 [Desulfatibacillum aliphaticivorans]